METIFRGWNGLWAPPNPNAAEALASTVASTVRQGANDDDDGVPSDLNLIPSVCDSYEVRVMTLIFSLVSQALVFAFLVVFAFFVIVSVPEAFTGKYFYVHTFLISTIVYFVLVFGAILLSRVFPGLVRVDCQQQQFPQQPPADLRCLGDGIFGQGETFQQFYGRQIDAQVQLMDRLNQLQNQLDRSFTVAVENQQARAAASSLQNLSQPCTHCRTESRPCPDCIRNPDCPCKVAGDQEERLRNLWNDQEVQITRMAEGARLGLRLDHRKSIVNPVQKCSICK